MINWHDWAAYYVSDSAMAKEHPQKYITLDELVREVMPLLSPYVQNTTVEIPVFTDLGVSDLKGNMRQLKNYYLSKQYQKSLNELQEAS